MGRRKMVATLKDAIIQGFIRKLITDKIVAIGKDKKAMNFLSGYKTYIIAVIMILLIALHYLGINIPGVDPNALDLGAAIGLITARGGASVDAAKAAATK
jgi:hypothetical protein